MSLETLDPSTDAANGVRVAPDLRSAEVYRFPASAIVRLHPGALVGRITVTDHQGRATVYPNEDALRAEVRARDPELQRRLELADSAVASARQALAAGRESQAEAKAAKARAERLLEGLAIAAGLAAISGLLIVLVFG